MESSSEKAGKSDITSETHIEKFVHRFYSKVEEDDRLGYIFNDHVAVDWEKHLPKMVEFWSQMLSKF